MHATPRPRTPSFASLAAAMLLIGSMGAATARAQTFCDFAPTVKVDFSPTRAAVGAMVHVTVIAEDPNGDAIASLAADTSALPPGNDAVFTPNGTLTGGELTWTPGPGQTGDYVVTYTASNALSGSATGTIHVVDTAGAPFVQAPANVTARVFESTTFQVYATDPDGDAIASLTASGLPFGATFSANGSNTAGTFSWTPTFTSYGSYTVVFTASNSLSGSASTFVLVPQIDRAPLVNVPPSAFGTEGSLLTICATAYDPDGDAITSFTVSPDIPRAQVILAPGNHVLTFQWTPEPGDAGSYVLQFTASNALSGTSSVSVTIAPSGADRPPTVVAPSSVSGPADEALRVSVTASDPDGDAIASLTASPLPAGATFTANATNTAGTLDWTPTIGQIGQHTISFLAQNALVGSAQTVVTVTEPTYPVAVFTVGGDKSLKLASGRTLWCAELQPPAGLYAVTDIDLASIILTSNGTGSVSQIHAVAGKTNVVGDQNHDGIADVQVCFTREDLRALFRDLNGKQTVTVSVDGSLLSGILIHGDLSIDVVAQGGQLAAVLSPNPPGGAPASLSFATTRPGRVRVLLFDVRGRLVRTLLDEGNSAVGGHAVAIDAGGAGAGRLPSGVYFYRVEATEGIATGRFALFR
ncbi:MAG TPA: Ig-like domain-containing protein [Candidatus Eisenbacteria bacterium]